MRGRGQMCFFIFIDPCLVIGTAKYLCFLKLSYLANEIGSNFRIVSRRCLCYLVTKLRTLQLPVIRALLETREKKINRLCPHNVPFTRLRGLAGTKSRLLCDGGSFNQYTIRWCFVESLKQHTLYQIHGSEPWQGKEPTHSHYIRFIKVETHAPVNNLCIILV